jgi:hypothetical protein
MMAYFFLSSAAEDDTLRSATEKSAHDVKKGNEKKRRATA